jgi:UDP-N-acetyl-D-galactosamine dehydrogenase
MDIYKEILEGKTKISIIGLGYVGLPLALEFAKKVSVIGFDINEDRINLLKNGLDPSRELESKAFEDVDIQFTSDFSRLQEASFHIVAVPTPIDKYNQPNLKPLLSATEIVAKVLQKGDYIVFESTVYPGATEEECLPLLEKISGLKFGEDFKLGYSPERINPGDKVHTLSNTIKIVSGSDEESLDVIARMYELVVTAGVHRAPNIKVAEAAKIIENTQRDVNIALMNELSIIFDRIGINTYDVLEAAGTKWNFLKFYPGLVGGHCIGVDPYYLVHKARELKYHPQMINAGRFINDSMGGYIAKKLVKKMIAQGKNILGCRVLLMGITFKENVSDIRNSKAVDIINELKDYGVCVDVIDPYASFDEVKSVYDIELSEKVGNDYDAVVLAVSHNEYNNYEEEYFTSITNNNAVFVDIKGIYKGKINKSSYWSL